MKSPDLFNTKKNGLTKMCTDCLIKVKETRRDIKCPHGRRKNVCKECKGSSICIHEKVKYFCKECKGSQICFHNKLRSKCKECEGGSICIHKKEKQSCCVCDPNGYVKQLFYSNFRYALKNNKNDYIEYLECDLETFKEHISSLFERQSLPERIYELGKLRKSLAHRLYSSNKI